jgi:hypothetical protein
VILPSKNRKQKKFLFESQAVNKAQAFMLQPIMGKSIKGIMALK